MILGILIFVGETRVKVLTARQKEKRQRFCQYNICNRVFCLFVFFNDSLAPIVGLAPVSSTFVLRIRRGWDGIIYGQVIGLGGSSLR